MEKYDVIIIGGGPGGYVAAVRAKQLGLRTAIVEKEALGGVCVNWGCIPTKSLLRNAEVVHTLTQGRTFGVKVDGFSADYASAQKRSRQVSTRQARRIQVLLKDTGIDVFEGEALLTSAKVVEIRPSGEKLAAENIIIATGSKSRKIPGIEPDGTGIITFKRALEMTKAPESVIVVGAGPIGLELATVWNRYGTKVTVLEMMPRVLPLEDEDVSAEATRQFKRAKMDIRLNASVKSATAYDNGVSVKVAQGDETETLNASVMLIAIGFAPNSQGLGLAEAGVKLNKAGYVEIDERMQTSVPGIYAIGDVTGKLGLAHAASAQGMIAAEAIAGLDTLPLVYENIPRCTYTFPEVASVGLSEAKALEQGFKAVSQLSPLAPNGKAVALNEAIGLFKIVVDSETDKVLGVHMVGPHVTEMIAGAAVAIDMGATVKDMCRTIYPHPTISEALMEGAHALAGHGIHI